MICALPDKTSLFLSPGTGSHLTFGLQFPALFQSPRLEKGRRDLVGFVLRLHYHHLATARSSLVVKVTRRRVEPEIVQVEATLLPHIVSTCCPTLQGCSLLRALLILGLKSGHICGGYPDLIPVIVVIVMVVETASLGPGAWTVLLVSGMFCRHDEKGGGPPVEGLLHSIDVDIEDVKLHGFGRSDLESAQVVGLPATATAASRLEEHFHREAVREIAVNLGGNGDDVGEGNVRLWPRVGHQLALATGFVKIAGLQKICM